MQANLPPNNPMNNNQPNPPQNNQPKMSKKN